VRESLQVMPLFFFSVELGGCPSYAVVADQSCQPCVGCTCTPSLVRSDPRRTGAIAAGQRRKRSVLAQQDHGQRFFCMPAAGEVPTIACSPASAS